MRVVAKGSGGKGGVAAKIRQSMAGYGGLPGMKRIKKGK